jgi:hypothetical protein
MGAGSLLSFCAIIIEYHKLRNLKRKEMGSSQLWRPGLPSFLLHPLIIEEGGRARKHGSGGGGRERGNEAEFIILSACNDNFHLLMKTET